MTLQEYIKILEGAPNKDHVCPVGLGDAISWRGDYSELAFEPKDDVSVGEMLHEAKSAIGKTFEGYKGGQFRMHEHTDVHIEYHGDWTDGGTVGAIIKRISTEIDTVGRTEDWLIRTAVELMLDNAIAPQIENVGCGQRR